MDKTKLKEFARTLQWPGWIKPAELEPPGGVKIMQLTVYGTMFIGEFEKSTAPEIKGWLPCPPDNLK